MISVIRRVSALGASSSLIGIAIALASACGEPDPVGPRAGLGVDPVVGPASEHPPVLAIVSDPAPVDGGVAASGALDAPAAALGSEVVYLSLAPGSLDEAAVVDVRNRASGASVHISIVDGGFDPVGIPGSAGDTIDFAVSQASIRPREWSEVVPLSSPPTIVRTEPARGKRDVPVALSIFVVFSEPMDSTTVDSATVRLLLREGSAPIEGELSFIDAARTTVQFVPATPLDAATDYELIVSGAVRDLDGDLLEESSSVTFTTAPAVASVNLEPTDVVLLIGDALQLRATVLDATGDTLIGRTVDWTSNAPAVAAVSATGLVTAISAGTATIVAASEGVAGAVSILVTSPVVRLDVFPMVATVQQGASVEVWAYAYTADQHHARILPSAWRVSDPSLLAISNHVQFSTSFTGLEAGGPVQVTLAVGSLVDTVQITVTPVPQGPSALDFASVSAGARHTCALTTSGVAYCWGSNSNGQLGDGTSNSSLVPVPVAGGRIFSSISAGENNTCGVTITGEGYCWGVAGGTVARTANLGLCGLPNTCDGTPALVRGGVAWRSLSAGGSHICGVTTNGAGRCWGWAWWGYAADSATATCGDDDPCFPPLVDGGLAFRSISAGHTWLTCGVTDSGAAYCWGYNYTGELGDGKPTDWALHASVEKNTSGPDNCADEDWGMWIACSVRPSAVVGGIAFTQVQAGLLSACGLASTGDAYCWGSNWDGELGNGSTVGSSSPVRVAGSHLFSMIANTQAGFACGLATNGHAFCWGRNDHGELGIPSVPTSPWPVAVSGDVVFASISAGGKSNWGGHTCGVTTAGSLYCWGSNQFGELGTGTNVSSSLPERVRGSQ